MLTVWPSPTLRSSCRKIELKEIESYHSLIEEMREELLQRQALGIAAPQVGKMLQLFLFLFEDEIFVAINPSLQLSKNKEEDQEGCLSLGTSRVVVQRSKKVKLQALNEHGHSYSLDATGLEARIIQHEYDHLQGKLICDYQLILPSQIEENIIAQREIEGP